MKIANAEFDSKKMRRYIGMFLAHPFLFLIRLVSYLFPRNKHVWAFGHPSKFEGNSKYLFLHIQNLKQKDIQTAWITRNKKLVRELKQKGYTAYYYFSLLGFLYCLRAKYFLVDTSIEVISYWLSGGATLVNLFHALPIKKMEWDVKKGDSTEVMLLYSRGIIKLLMRFLFPWRFLKPNYVMSTSPLYTKIFMSAFRIGKERIVETGYPRNDILLSTITGSEIGSDMGVISQMKQIKKENPATKFCFYAPTFRDTGDSSFLESSSVLECLDKFCVQCGAVFWVKLHPFSRIKIPQVSFKNIHFIPPLSDSYPLLKMADVLITDYSSIFVDFLLLNRPIVFFSYDYEKYITKDRELYFDYKEFTPGEKAYTFNQFLDVFERVLQGQDEYVAKRLVQQKRCFDNINGNDSARTFAFLNSFCKNP